MNSVTGANGHIRADMQVANRRAKTTVSELTNENCGEPRNTTLPMNRLILLRIPNAANGGMCGVSGLAEGVSPSYSI
jgi:hypothetical protein